MRLTTAALLLLSTAAVLTSPTGAEARVQEAELAVEPFRVVGNIFYVGGRFGSYLITTPEGHILHDTGSADMHAPIVSNIEKLGFNGGHSSGWLRLSLPTSSYTITRRTRYQSWIRLSPSTQDVSPASTQKDGAPMWRVSKRASQRCSGKQAGSATTRVPPARYQLTPEAQSPNPLAAIPNRS